MNCVHNYTGKRVNGVLLCIVVVLVMICADIHFYTSPAHRGTETVDSGPPFKYKKNVHLTRLLMGELPLNNGSNSTRPTAGDQPLENDHAPVSDHSICENATLMPAGTMPVIALASLPGSGNTWCRHLIESVTGIYTGSIYIDRSLLKGGFLGEASEPYSGETVAVKMHKMEHPEKINRTILLVRDFYDAALAEFNRQQAVKRDPKAKAKGDAHTYVPDNSAYTKTKDFNRVVSGLTKQWQKLMGTITDKFSTGNRLLVVYFDDLKTDLDGQLRRMVDFVGLPLDKERLECTLHNAEGNFHRPHHDISLNPFTKEMLQAIKSTVEFAQDAMVKHGLSRLRINTTSSKFSL